MAASAHVRRGTARASLITLPEVENQPPSTLWTARNKGRWIECIVRLLPVGVDVEIIVDGAPLVGRTFETSEEALEFAERQKVKWAIEND